MLTLHKLKIFVTVVEHGSFNKAAQELLMSQSAVSQHMSDLEVTLGADLFTRTPRGVTKTESGEILHTYAQQMLHLAAEVEREIVQVGQLRDIRLALGTTPGVSVYILPAWLRQFQAVFNHINVSLNAGLTTKVVEGVLSEHYDLGFLEGDLGDLSHSQLGQLDLWQIEYQVMVSAEHPLSQEKVISLKTLAQQPFINRQPSSRTRRWLEQTLAEVGITLNNTAELDSPGTIKYALLSDMGVGILPEYAVVGERKRGEIKTLKIDGLTLKRPFKLVWNKRQPFNPVQRAFLNLIRERIPHIGSLL